VTAFYASRKPPGTIGAARKHVIPYRKHPAKAQPLRQVSKQHQELVDAAIAANALCKRLRGN
jgi:hypothetical protein